MHGEHLPSYSLPNLQRMLMDAPIGVLLADHDGRCIFTNEACRQLFGVGDSTLQGLGWSKLLATDDRDRMIDCLHTLVSNRERKRQCEFGIENPLGMHRCVADMCRVYEEQSRITRVIMYIREVSPALEITRQTQSRYREIVSRLNSIMALIEDAVFEIDGNMVFREIWVADETMLFIPREQFLGRSIADVFGREQAPIFAAPVDQAIQTGKPAILEYRHIDPTIEKWFRLKVVPIEQYGEPDDRRLAIVIQEITEEVLRNQKLKEVQAGLEQRNELLNISEQLSQTGGWEYDLITGSVSWTKQMYVILGVPGDRDFSRFDASLELFPGPDREVVLQSLERCKNDRMPYTIEIRIATPQGELKWVRVQAVPVVENGLVVKLRGALMDIHKEKLEAIELMKAKELAERAAQVKTDFLSVMSHEIRTPLVGIIGSSNHLKQAHLPEHEETINNLLFSSEHLLRLVNEVLDFNKMESGQLKLIQAEVNLWELVENIKNQFQEMALAKGVNVLVEVARSVPHRIIGDPTRLSQILYNLVSNALKFTDEGQVMIVVNEVARTDDGVTLHFSVRDTGSGIPEAYHEEIFKDFQQLAQNTHKKQAGFGLGLTITKGLVELHNSRIMLRSTPGKGAEFFFDIRFALPEPAASAPADGLPSVGREGNPANLQGMRGLLVEDNPISTTVIRKQLEQLGMVVDCAGDGEEALHYLMEGTYTVALVDLHMPKMDGYVLSEIICREYPDTQIIILTADIMAETRLKLAKLNILKILNKPFRPADLRAALGKVKRHS